MQKTLKIEIAGLRIKVAIFETRASKPYALNVTRGVVQPWGYAKRPSAGFLLLYKRHGLVFETVLGDPVRLPVPQTSVYELKGRAGCQKLAECASRLEQSGLTFDLVLDAQADEAPVMTLKGSGRRVEFSDRFYAPQFID